MPPRREPDVPGAYVVDDVNANPDVLPPPAALRGRMNRYLTSFDVGMFDRGRTSRFLPTTNRYEGLLDAGVAMVLAEQLRQHDDLTPEDHEILAEVDRRTEAHEWDTPADAEARDSGD